jgi:ABC-type proline/glycine betaine transport system permease subunit
MFGEALETLRRLPKSLLALHMVAKFLFGVGVGILLSHYREVDGGVVGWVFIVIAVIVAIPSSIRVFSGLRGHKT